MCRAWLAFSWAFCGGEWVCGGTPPDQTLIKGRRWQNQVGPQHELQAHLLLAIEYSGWRLEIEAGPPRCSGVRGRLACQSVNHCTQRPTRAPWVRRRAA